MIDALNQLVEQDSALAWLPAVIPSGIKLVVSVTPGISHQALARRQWREIEVQPLTDEATRAEVVTAYLKEFRKRISNAQLARIVSDPKASSPLFLRVIAEELRLHGEHETLDQAVDRYASASDLHEVFQRVMGRIEGDHGEARTRDILSLLRCSRLGLGEAELLDLTGTSRLDLSRLLLTLDYHLVRRNGLLGFFHDYLERAVSDRYLADADVRVRMHQRLGCILHRSCGRSAERTGTCLSVA